MNRQSKDSVMTRKLIFNLILCVLIGGCTGLKQGGGEKLLSEEEIHKALMNSKPPQQFGFNVYPTQGGIAMSGSARLHPRHKADVPFESREMPVIKMGGISSRMSMYALLDPAAAESWMSYDVAKSFRATFLGLDGRFIPYRGPVMSGQADAYAAVVSQMRIDQLFIENAPVYVRMATGSMGPAARGILKPHIGGVIGYEILKNFEYIQFNLLANKIYFSSTVPYTPDENLLIGQAAIVAIPRLGLAVDGAIDGQAVPILLDFAGNFEFARTDLNTAVTKQIGLGNVVYLNVPTILVDTVDGYPRAGNLMLRKYIVTICPRAGLVYFEQPVL